LNHLVFLFGPQHADNGRCTHQAKQSNEDKQDEEVGKVETGYLLVELETVNESELVAADMHAFLDVVLVEVCKLVGHDACVDVGKHEW
jgi:hypothetical protein